ncbi:MAG: bifunctional diaminohydroxyphosphoribosylaminopyrimidine deaminase/5-amino-6-(5-phosphoribosylamino)uracil reductase RibD [Pirellulales bacterium]|nr:bifunctional diaminohydroxyphosphoribosylaminopyrimidine deaminase/5-amino-6-(5-phosphoribosylamino)uracil reductase RibD [Pirellulales bacterium]
MRQVEIDRWHLARALELAAAGRGLVEPNPLVGCLVARGAEIIGEGWHRRYGGPHAEVEALAIAGQRARGATLYVTLEPCSHHGKTPPCVDAIIAASIARVVVAQRDPFPQVDGAGIQRLRAAGIEVEVGLLEDEARELNAPYLKLLATGRPWVIAKWAMTLDGKIATATGDSRWISNEASREVAHELRRQVDAIVVGRGTVKADDPLLTARPAGPRVLTRIVLDSAAALDPASQLARTAHDSPVLVAAASYASEIACQRLRQLGVEVFRSAGDTPLARWDQLLLELGRRRMTNILVEGGGRVLGSLFASSQIDEAHVFVAPKLVGGAAAPSPLAGDGVPQMALASQLQSPRVRVLGGDVYICGRIAR